MAIDTKYGRVTLEKGSIGEDEPVFIFRAQDALTTLVLEDYVTHCIFGGVDPDHLDAIDLALEKIRKWQSENPTKLPDTDSTS